MSCERYTDAIVDHACGAEIAADAAAHLEGCAACGRMFAEQRRQVEDVDRQLQLALAIEPSVRFVPEVMARAQQPPFAWRRLLAWSTAVAAAAVLVLVTFGALRSGQRPVAHGHDPVVLSTASPAPNTNPAPPKLPPPTGSGEKPRPPELRPIGVPASIANRSNQVAAQPKQDHRRGLIEAVVMVPSVRSQSLARYLTLVRRGALDTSSLVSRERAGVEAPTDLVIAPLAVDALGMPDVERGVGPAVDRRGPGIQ